MEDWNPLSEEKENSKRKTPGEERIIRGENPFATLEVRKHFLSTESPPREFSGFFGGHYFFEHHAAMDA